MARRREETPKGEHSAGVSHRKFLRHYAELEVLLEQWTANDERGDKVLSSLANIITRLPIIQSAARDSRNAVSKRSFSSSSSTSSFALSHKSSSALGVLSCMNGIGELLLDRHFEELEKLMVYMRAILNDFGDLIKEMMKLVDDVYTAYESEKSINPKIAVARGGRPMTLADYVDCIDTVYHIYCKELFRKQRLVDTIRYEMGEQVKDLHDMWKTDSTASEVSSNWIHEVLTRAKSTV